MTLSRETVNQITQMLGRRPRGLEAVAVTGVAGTPTVIRVSSLVDDKPFPTLFWLVDPELCYRIDQLEAGGLIMEFQRRIDKDAELQQSMLEDHRAYIALRDNLMQPTVRNRLQELGFDSAMAERGIGGIANFTRIRCLHTWYGAHLVVPNTVGGMLDDWWRQQT